jgi:PKD repeat protein
LLIFGICNQIHASRAVGGELTYTYNSVSKQYEVSVVIYYNCAARSTVLNNYTVEYGSQSIGKSGTFIVSKVNEELISSSCKKIKNTCEGGKAFGFKKISYSGLFKPDAIANDWILNWTECNRNAEINTINSPDTECIYLEALLNNLNAPGNSSPQFSASPVSLLCEGETRILNYNVFDSNNNRLVMTLVTPKTGPNTNVTYKSGFSANSPLSSNPAVTFSQNGDIKVNPTVVGEQTILAILVQEYDQNNVLIGSVIRDAQMIVIDCNNRASQLSGFNGTNNYGDVSSIACANHQECFYLVGSDPDAKDKNVYFNFIQPLKDMILYDPDFDNTVKFIPGKNPSKVGVCWTPTTSDIGIKKFLVSVTDSACPIMGTQTFLYTVTVNPGMATYFPFKYKKIRCDTMVEILPQVFGGAPPYTYFWNTGKTTLSIKEGPGKYTLTVLDAKGCIDIDTIVLDGGLNVDFNYEKGCVTSHTRFYDTSSATGGITARLWSFGDGTTGTGKNPIHTYNATSIYKVTLTDTDALGCSLSVTKPIEICYAARFKIDALSDTFTIKSADTSKCRLYTIASLKLITLDPSYCEAPYSASWKWGNGQTSTGVNPQKMIFTVSGVFTVTSIVLTKNCLSDTLTRQVTILESPDAFLSSTDYYQRCDTGRSKLIVASVTSTNFAPYKFAWAFNDVLNENVTTSGYNITAVGMYTVTVTNSLSAFNVLCVASKKSLFPKFAPQDFCVKTSLIEMNNETNVNGSYFGISLTGWDFGDGIVDASNKKYSPSHNFLSDSVFIATLYHVDNAGCTDSTKRTIVTYLPYDTLKVVSSRLSCFSEKIELLGPKGKSINSYKWNFGSGEPYIKTTAGVAITDSIVQVGNPPLDLDIQYTFNGSDGYYLPMSAGKKSISLELTYNNTCKKSYYDTAHVFKQLKVNAKIEGQSCVGKVVSFTGNLLKAGDYPIKNWWLSLFRDPTHAVAFYLDTTKTGLPFSFPGQSFNFKFQEQDYNLIRIRVADNNPLHVCLADTIQDVNIHNITTPGFTFINSCVDAQITYVNPQVYDPYGTQDLLIVYFGDDSISYYPGGNISDALHHTYADTGIYTVKFKVLDSTFFCADSLVKKHTIYGLPVADFSYNIACEIQKTYFENKSVPAKNIHPIVKTAWIIERDSISNRLESVSHTFGSYGTYSINLTVEDTLGCKGNTIKQVVVNPTPIAEFYFDSLNAFAFQPIQFDDKSNAGGVNSVIVSWLWHFGDGDSSTIQSLAHTYNDVKIFKAKLLVTNQFGCKDDTIREVDLNPYLVLPTAFSPNDDHLNDHLNLILKGIKSVDNFKIYNRWGELVFQKSYYFNDGHKFEPDDFKIGWDGSFNGIKQPPGVYQYYVTGKSIYNTEMKPLHGNILLVH